MTSSLLLLGKKNKPAIDWSFLGALPSALTLTRASSKWRFNSAGILVEVGSNLPAFGYDPLTHELKGLSLEAERTNSVANSTMQGAVVGTPGTLPTGWARGTDSSGLSAQVVGLGTEYGMPYIDLRVYGTSTGAQTTFYVNSSSSIAAAQNETWTASVYHKLISGDVSSFANLRARFSVYNSVPSYLQQYVSYNSPPTSALKRDVVTGTIAEATAAYIRLAFELYGNSGAEVDIVMRVYQPQLEKGYGATSPIPTTTAAVTRAADNLDITSVPWFNANAGSLAVDYMLSSVNPASDPRVAMFNAGAETDRLGVYVKGTDGNKMGGIVAAGGSATADTPAASPTTALTASAVSKQAMRYAANDVAVSNNGSAVQTDNTVTLPSGIDRLTFFRKIDDGSQRANGYLRRFRYWNRALDNVLLQRLAA